LLQLYPELTTWLAVPYRQPANGVLFSDLDGWDCWGLVIYLGRTVFGVEHGDFAGMIARATEGRDSLANGEVAAMIRDALPLYRAVPPAAGRIALFRHGSDFLHVGLMLTPTIAIHALMPGADGRGGGTFTIDLTNDRWGKPHRFVGCYERVAA
jgi:cell wall-associated NlpC family hydrolase